MRVLSAANRLAARASEAVAIVFLAVAAFIVPTSVFFRYVLNQPIIWSEEVVQGLIAWVVFLCISVVLRRDEHVRIELVESKVSGFARRVVYLVADASLLAFLLVAALTSLLLTLSNFEREARLPATGLPLGLIYASMPVGFGLSAVNALERLLLRAAGRELPKDPDQLADPTAVIGTGSSAGDEVLVR